MNVEPLKRLISRRQTTRRPLRLQTVAAVQSSNYLPRPSKNNSRLGGTAAVVKVNNNYQHRVEKRQSIKKKLHTQVFAFSQHITTSSGKTSSSLFFFILLLPLLLPPSCLHHKKIPPRATSQSGCVANVPLPDVKTESFKGAYV